MSGADEYLSPSEAAAKLGWRGKPKDRARRLLRVLRAKERALGVSLVVDVSEGKGRPNYRTTMRLLRRYCREMFVRGADELAKDFRKHLERIDERIDDRIDMLVTPQLEELRAVDDEIIRQVKQIQVDLRRAANG